MKILHRFVTCLLIAWASPSSDARTIIRVNSPGANGMGASNSAVGQTFGDLISLAAPGNAVFETAMGSGGFVGTPGIDLAWSATGGSNANRWEFHTWSGATTANSGGGVMQMDGSSLNSRFSILFTPSGGSGVILNSFNFVGDTNNDTFQYRVDVVNTQTNGVEWTASTPQWTTVTSQNPGTNGTYAGAPVVNINFTGAAGVAYRLDLVRVGGSGTGSAVNIAIDNLDFDQSAPPDPGLPPVLATGPAGPGSLVALSAASYSFQATDPEGANVQIQVDWGDGRLSAWSAAVPSGTPVVFSRAYPHSGSFTLRARARDLPGAVSAWEEIQVVVVSTAPGVPDGLVGLWEFDSATQPGLATYGTDLEVMGTAPTHSASVTDGRADPNTLTGVITTVAGPGNHLRATHGIGANGYGSLTNTYTIVMDLLQPSAGQWRTLWQTNLSNTDDGEYFIRNTNSTLGITGLGYSTSGFPVNEWRRLVVSVDLTSTGFYRAYLDGELFFIHTRPALDGRHALNPSQLLFHADENQENQPLVVGMTAIFSKALSAEEASALASPGVKLIPAAGNQAPQITTAHGGASTGETGTDLEFSFLPEDSDGDLVQVQVDWGDGRSSPWSSFGPAGQARVMVGQWNLPGTYDIRARVRDANGAVSAWVQTGAITVTGTPVLTVRTPPYLQNMSKTGMTVMAEFVEDTPLILQYGTSSSLGQAVVVERVASGGGSYFYRGVITGLSAGTSYYYRFAAVTGEGVTALSQFRTAPAVWEDFTFGAIGDVQTTNGGVWQADPWEPAKIMLGDMLSGDVSFCLALGDQAQDGNAYSTTKSSYLDRMCAVFGRQKPFYVSWGNHDGSSPNHPLRLASDMPSRWQIGDSASTRTAGFGNYWFEHAGVFFVCLDYFTTHNRSATDPTNDITNGWLDGVLSSEAARQARFRIVATHVSPFYERWIDGNAALRANLVPRLEEHGVDLCLSGHMHGYERGRINGIYYVVSGCGSYLDFTEPLVANWSSATDDGVWWGGHVDIPGSYARQQSNGVLGPAQPIDGGLFHGYSKITVRDRYLRLDQHGFNADGSSIGILDSIEIGGPDPGPDTDGDGMRDAWELANGLNPNSSAGMDGGDFLWPNGMTGAEHHLAGTDPRAAVAGFRITAVEPEGGQVRVTWASVAGKRYQILVSSDLLNWTRVMDDGLAFEVVASGPVTQAMLTPPSGQRVFVKVEVVP